MALADDVKTTNDALAALTARVERVEKEKATTAELAQLREDARGSHEEQTRDISAVREQNDTTRSVLNDAVRDAQETRLLSEGARDDLATLQAALQELTARLVRLEERPVGEGASLPDPFMQPKVGFPFGLYRVLIPASENLKVIAYMEAEPLSSE